jgi:hypothetical protein
MDGEIKTVRRIRTLTSEAWVGKCNVRSRISPAACAARLATRDLGDGSSAAGLASWNTSGRSLSSFRIFFPNGFSRGRRPAVRSVGNGSYIGSIGREPPKP